MMKRGLLIAIAVPVVVLLVSCQLAKQTVEVPVEVEVTRIVTETVFQQGEPVEVTRVVKEQIVVEVTPEGENEAAEAITYNTASQTDIPTLDPQVAEDEVSITYIENLFVQLTNYDPVTSEIVPEAAVNWQTSEDGRVYTFTLRTDIPWVRHNPVTGETIQEVDEEGEPRFVTAHNFVYGIKRACDPRLGSSYSSVFAPLIVGCADMLNAPDLDAITPDLNEAIGVYAPADNTLVVELTFPASYFLAMTPLWTLAATPQWAIEAHGDDWIEAGNIVTNGRYVLHEWIHNVHRTLTRNPLLPEDMQGQGNIERFVTTVVPDITTEYALWHNNEVDHAHIPNTELQNHLHQFAEQTTQTTDLAVLYIGFRMTKFPFDDVRVRRAFSAAIDRETFIEEVLQGQGEPMKQFTPLQIFGDSQVEEVGIGFDVEYAQAQLAEAGYPDCEGFPEVELLGGSTANALNQLEFFQSQWAEHLGCQNIILSQSPFSELLDATAASTKDEDVPHMWTLGWRPDYADQQNWVGDVLWCQSSTRSKRACNEIDDLIVQAREEQDPAVRRTLYLQIEEMFFGREGEFPFAPTHLRIQFQAEHTWVDRVHTFFGGQPWYLWRVDWDAKLAAKQ